MITDKRVELLYRDAEARLLFATDETTRAYHRDVSEAARELMSLRTRLKRYEDWRPITDPPRPGELPSALYHFACYDDSNERYYTTDIWACRPASADQYCPIVSPLGPHS